MGLEHRVGSDWNVRFGFCLVLAFVLGLFFFSLKSMEVFKQPGNVISSLG